MCLPGRETQGRSKADPVETVAKVESGLHSTHVMKDAQMVRGNRGKTSWEVQVLLSASLLLSHSFNPFLNTWPASTQSRRLHIQRERGSGIPGWDAALVPYLRVIISKRQTALAHCS